METWEKELLLTNAIRQARMDSIEKAVDTDLEKARQTKYFKREGTPGHYKYYYTEAEYKQAKGGGGSKYIDSEPSDMKHGDGSLLTKEEQAAHEKNQQGLRDLADYSKQEQSMGKKEESSSKWMSEVDQSISNSNSKAEEEIQKIKIYTNRYNQHLSKLKSMLPSIEKAVTSYGATIDTLNYYKTGISDSNKVWGEKDSLTVSMRLLPTSKSKMKFYEHAGYTKSGSDKNESKLKEQADKLESFLKDSLNIDSSHIEVNQYSFQNDINKHSKSVLVDIWIKA